MLWSTSRELNQSQGQFILGNLAPALEPAGVLILEHHRLADDFVCHRQRHTLSVVNAVEDVDALDSVLAVIEVPTDARSRPYEVSSNMSTGCSIFLTMGDLLPEGPGVVDILGQEAGYPVIIPLPASDRPVAVAAPKELSRYAVEFGQFFVHGSKIAAFFSLCVRSVTNYAGKRFYAQRPGSQRQCHRILFWRHNTESDGKMLWSTSRELNQSQEMRR